MYETEKYRYAGKLRPCGRYVFLLKKKRKIFLSDLSSCLTVYVNKFTTQPTKIERQFLQN